MRTMRNRCRLQTVLSVGIVGLLAMSGTAAAKERHFEQLRVLLIARTARCASCHAADDGKQLNLYGEAIAARPKDDPLADRILAVEADPAVAMSDGERAKQTKDQDVDGDGVPNWIEILAGANPGDAADKPMQNRIDRVKRVVSCTICHTATGLPGEGLTANPHNAYGELLAKTVAPSKDERKPTREAAIRAAAERVPILQRIELTQKKRPKRSKATFWEKLRLFHSPADDEDNPGTERLKTFRRRASKQKRKSTRDATRGIETEAHKEDGFLVDGEGLD